MKDRVSRQLPNLVVLVGFLAVHLLLAVQGSHGIGTPMGDITTAYLPWARQMSESGVLLGLGAPWVYPFPNLFFVEFPALLAGTSDSNAYQAAWLALVTVLNLLAAAALIWATGRDSRRGRIAVLLWAAGLLALGPTSVSRLDTPSVAVAMIAVAFWLRGREGAASAAVVTAVWLKVWPIAMLGGVLAAAVRRGRAAWAALAAGAAIGLLGIVLGAGQNLQSFFTTQTNRGIQIESLWAAPWLWGGVLKVPGTGLYYDTTMLTFQVKGDSSSWLAALLGPVMYGAIAITFYLGWAAARRLREAGSSGALTEVLAWTTLTGTLDLIVFNKVGSPQYYGWLVVPLVLAAVAKLPRWTLPTVGVLALLVVTQLVYPTLYDRILSGDAFGTAVLTARNLLAVGMLVMANLRLGALGKNPKAAS